MAQSKNKKRRSRKRNRSGGGNGSGAGSAGADAPTASSADASPGPRKANVTKAQRAAKARQTRKEAPGPPSVKADRSQAPKPIWAPLPITEGLILFGLIGAVAGLVSKSTGLVLGGFALIVLSSLELAVREHMAGYRSHSSLIAGVSALIVAAALKFILDATDVGLPQWPLLIIALFVFVGLFRVMRLKFKERSGGLTYRV